MAIDPDKDLQVRREYKIAKANEIVQRARYELSLSELKLLSYIFSLIKPGDQVADRQYVFTVQEFSSILGIDEGSGKNYKDVKNALKKLRDKSFWLKQEDGSEILVGWLATAEIKRGSGKVNVTLDKTLSKYLTGLITNYTQYELLSTLPMQSTYSFRIYELLKSYAFQHEHTFDIDELKELLMAQRYVNFKDFRRKVIEIAVREINEYTDIEVAWDPIMKGRKVEAIHFEIDQRDRWGSVAAAQRAREALNNKDQIKGQLSLDDYINDPDAPITITMGD